MPANGAGGPGAEHFVATPGPVKPSVRSIPDISTIPAKHVTLLPVKTSIFLQASPDVAGDVVKGPGFVIETSRVPSEPNLPQREATQHGPNEGKTAKCSRKTLSENTVLPVKKEMD